MIAHEAFRGLRAGIVGAAREGTALARFLAACHARVTLSDAKPAQALGERLAQLAGLDVRLALGGAPLNLADLDVLFLSPGVPPNAPIVGQARELGLPLSSEPRLFTQVCAAPVVGITGSSGKTTTTALVGRMFACQGLETWVGGNIGEPLTERLLEPAGPDVAVLELSSFQLELFSPDYQGPAVEERRTAASRVLSLDGWSPRVAAVTNITPNHLDRHPSMEDYARAKANIVRFQTPDGWAVLNRDDPRSYGLRAEARGRVLLFSLREPVDEGGYRAGDRLLLRLDGRETDLCRVGQVPLRGAHNLANVLTAACCAMAGGATPEAMREAVRTFSGVAHRLEIVREVGGVTYVNDSIATSPERAIAALRAYREPLVLLAGGRDKNLPWEEWADLALQRARVVIAFGEAAPIIEAALAGARDRWPAGGDGLASVERAVTMAEGVALAARLARPGDVVLLSPGGTSFDAFDDFEQRGQAFRDQVRGLGE